MAVDREETGDGSTEDSTSDAVLDTLGALGGVSTTAIASSQRTVSSPWRANRILGRIVPWLLSAFILSGWHYVTFVLPWTHAYLVVFNALIAALYGLFLMIWFKPTNHSAPPEHPPLAILTRSVTYECVDADGNLAACWQDSCNGRWLPPKARHCKDCRVCRLDFDHCCLWFGPNCIARDTIKPFMVFLALTPLTIAVGLFTVGPIALRHASVVIEQQWQRPELYEAWWDRWYSWIGGPAFRLGGGLLLSYWRFDGQGWPKHPLAHANPQPSIGPLLWTILGSLLAILTLALLVVTIKNRRAGLTTLEVERERQRTRGHRVGTSKFIWIPDNQQEYARDGRMLGKVMQIPTEL